MGARPGAIDMGECMGEGEGVAPIGTGSGGVAAVGVTTEVPEGFGLEVMKE